MLFYGVLSGKASPPLSIVLGEWVSCNFGHIPGGGGGDEDRFFVVHL